MARQLTIEVNVDTGKATTSLRQVDAELGKTGQTAEQAGAVERLLDRCEVALGPDGRAAPLDRLAIQAAVEAMGREGLRVLARLAPAPLVPQLAFAAAAPANISMAGLGRMDIMGRGGTPAPALPAGPVIAPAAGGQGGGPNITVQLAPGGIQIHAQDREVVDDGPRDLFHVIGPGHEL